MATEAYIGEIRAVSFGYAPKNWAFCNGQTMAISQNQALFSILGTTYGGNGTTTFNLPNLQGSVPAGTGNGVGLGQVAGAAAVTLNGNQIGHSHGVAASATANAVTAANDVPAASPANNIYGPAPDTTMNPATVLPAGGSQAHNNMQPYLVVNYIICLYGIFPSRN